MANNPWDQVILNVRERPLSTDMNQQWSQSARSLREMLKYLLGVRTAVANPTLAAGEGFLGDSFRVGPESPASMNIVVRAGYGFQNNGADVPVAIGSVTGLDDRSSYKPLVLNAAQTIAVPAADPTNPRIDIVEVAYDRYTTDSSSRDVLDTGTGQFVATLVNKTLAFLQDGRTSVNGAAKINYKTGTPAGSPAAPSTTAGYIKIAEVLVDAAATSIAENKITDLRKLLFPNGIGMASGRVTMPATGVSLLPTLSNLQAPPGVDVIARGVSVSGSQVEIAVRAGAQVAGFTPQASLLYLVTGSEFRHASITVTSSAVATSGDVAAYADAAVSAPVTQVAEGQPIFRFRVRQIDQNDAVTDPSPVTPDPATYHFTVFWSY
jgi:hypothetical protein